VAGFDAALAWYERLFDRPPDMRPNDIEACWQLAEHGWVYIVEDAEHAGGGTATVIVDDLAEWLPRLDGEPSPVGGMRSVWVDDPDGNRIQIAGPG
jgi:catechol 2,3-dioxygenase-like lactoylglutathione lyase family enzyme